MISAKHVWPMIALAFAGCTTTPPQPPPIVPAAPVGARHVASPDWRDQIIYFAMIDRFDDGNPANNDQGAGEFDPTRGSHYSGGDLKGLERRLDYVQALGATALWITPPVANQWWNPSRNYTGYHGYWTEHFKEIDSHYGSLADYQSLAEALHGRGMYLVQDIVVNHTGNWFGYDEGLVEGDAVRGYVRYGEAEAGGTGHGAREEQGAREASSSHASRSGETDRALGRGDHPCPVPHAPCPALAPSQPPFHQNDPRDPAQRAAAIYHWTPDIRDYQDPNQEANYQMAGLDDLNTENPEVRRALRDSYGYWIREVGVDGFRVDTAFYVPPEYFEDFVYSDDPAAPGIDAVARGTGRQAFLNFGEGFAVDAPYSDKAARKIDSYIRSAAGRRRLQGMLNFPVYGSLGDAFARGRPTAELAHRIESMQRVHADPHLMPSFIDNHDVDRFLAGGSVAALKQALLAQMTLPGIPVIYYGTEQGFREPRAAMFAAGHGSGGRDHFDTRSALFQYTRSAIALRRAHPVLSRGRAELLHSNPARAGALAWRMRDGEEQVIVVFNTADEPVLLDHLVTGLAAGSELTELFAIEAAVAGSARDASVGAEGALTLVLPPRSAFVWMPQVRDEATAHISHALPTLTVDPTMTETHAGDFEITGTASGPQRLQLVVDGQLAAAHTVEVDAEGHWRALVDTAAMLDPSVQHRLVAFDRESGAVSAPLTFQVQRQWKQLAAVVDATGDDHGRSGRYQYPADPAWREQRPNDIEQVVVQGSGGALRVDLTLHQVLATWNPPNGFDHVAFTIYIELPDREDGATTMPLQFAELPDGMRWHYRIRAHGWSNALFSSDGASATTDGTPVIPTATIATDAVRRSVSFTLPSAALGNPATLSGARIYISTWDYDGGYRELAAEAGPHTYGGGAADQPRVMDEVMIRLP